MTAPPPTEAHPPTPLTVPKSSLPDVAVRVEPDTGTKIGHMVGHIPVLRRLRKQPAGFVPPLALRQVNPAITARQRHGLTEDVPIDVKVMVGKSGKVEDAEVLSRTDHQPLLADLALSAARRWEFAPAHVGSDKMAGAVILHFTFLMDQPPPAPR